MALDLLYNKKKREKKRKRKSIVTLSMENINNYRISSALR